MNIRSGFHGQFNQRNNNNNSNNNSGGWNSWRSQNTQSDQTSAQTSNSGWDASWDRNNSASNSGWDSSNWGNSNTASHSSCGNTATNTSSNSTDNTDTSSNGTQQNLTGMQQVMASMVSMMTQMMSQLLGNQTTSTSSSTSTTPTLSTAPTPVIDPTQIDFSNDSDLQQRQYDLIGGRNSQIDTLLNTVNTSDPSSTESADAQQQIGDLWTEAGGDPNALKEFTTLQTVRKENSVISSLTTTQQSLDPSSAEYTSITNQIAGSQLIQQGEIAIAKALETSS
jgi:hypothetical protein